MNKKTFRKTVTNKTLFWVIMGSEKSIARIENVGGNRFCLVFSTKENAEAFYRNEDKKSMVDMCWCDAVRQKPWGEILEMTGGDKRSVYYHFDLPAEANEIDHDKIVHITPSK